MLERWLIIFLVLVIFGSTMQILWNHIYSMEVYVHRLKIAGSCGIYVVGTWFVALQFKMIH